MDPVTRQINIYENILKHPVWGNTPLLSVFAARLNDMLKQLKQSRGLEVLPEGGRYVYVLLYHLDGSGVKTWEQVLRNIRYAVQSRPVCFCEEEAQQLISNHRTEGYVKLMLPSESIVQADAGVYLHTAMIDVSSVRQFFWQNKSFVFNGMSLIEAA